MKLEERDKKILIIGGIVAAVILLYALVISPLYADLSRKQDLIPRKEKDLAEMRVLKDQYLDMQKRLEQLQAAAAKRGPLLTEIETVTRRSNLNNKIVSLKPLPGVEKGSFKESIVEIKLEKITLYDIINYVHLLEKESLRIRKLYFKPRFDDPKLLNATIQISSAG